MPLWRDIDERSFLSIYLFIYLFRRTQRGTQLGGYLESRGRARVRNDITYRYVSLLITGSRRLFQPRRPSETAVGAADPRRVCHCTGTRRTRRRVTSISPHFRGIYISVSRKARTDRDSRAANFAFLCLASRRRRRLSAARVACPHGLIDARTAPLTTPSLRRRVSILRGEETALPRTGHTRRREWR